MTKEEKIIATAFTGKMFIDGSEMGLLYEYMEKKLGHGVIDLMLASKEFWEELHNACEQDFIDMISKERTPIPANLDEAAHSYAWEKQEHHIDFDGDEYLDYGPRYDAFKSGVEWMAKQYKTLGETEIYLEDDGSEAPYTQEWLDLSTTEFAVPEGFKAGDKVIIQIRKR